MIKRLIPWWGKILAKVLLSRVPVSHQAWRRFGIFVHGPSDSPEYAHRVLASHLGHIGWRDLKGKTVLELGPGNSLLTALVASGFGAERTYLVDVGSFAKMDVAQYIDACDYLEQQGLKLPSIRDCTSMEDVLSVCRAEYWTNGLEDLQRIPAGSVDLVWSQAVLEHIRLSEIELILAETRRILSSDGVASHEVDLRDHLANALNNLRFSDKVWESELFADSGFYTNRLRCSEMLDLFRGVGLAPEVVKTTQWDALPTPRRSLQPRFRALPENELLLSTFTVVAKPIELDSS